MGGPRGRGPRRPIRSFPSSSARTRRQRDAGSERVVRFSEREQGDAGTSARLGSRCGQGDLRTALNGSEGILPLRMMNVAKSVRSSTTSRAKPFDSPWRSSQSSSGSPSTWLRVFDADTHSSHSERLSGTRSAPLSSQVIASLATAQTIRKGCDSLHRRTVLRVAHARSGPDGGGSKRQSFEGEGLVRGAAKTPTGEAVAGMAAARWTAAGSSLSDKVFWLRHRASAVAGPC